MHIFVFFRLPAHFLLFWTFERTYHIESRDVERMRTFLAITAAAADVVALLCTCCGSPVQCTPRQLTPPITAIVTAEQKLQAG